jgi:hypothetical protein
LTCDETGSGNHQQAGNRRNPFKKHRPSSPQKVSVLSEVLQ